ncbi:hypothetical protein PR048_030289 [Dryococelus australis]|uniref:Reverse transcriptase domain-containing protein n=1 Tax=Dryococelus australis TaxID=614101 RepID=A0ABQ9G8J6_9NEOP|nr:hypothetical protein PR048_030289 [Dryococelus australis]
MRWSVRCLGNRFQTEVGRKKEGQRAPRASRAHSRPGSLARAPLLSAAREHALWTSLPTERERARDRISPPPTPHCLPASSLPLPSATSKLRICHGGAGARTHGSFDLRQAILSLSYAGEATICATKSLETNLGFNPRPVHSRIFACGNRAGRCHWSAGFSWGLPFPPPPPPLHSGAAPYSPQFTFNGSQDLDVKSRPNLCAHPLLPPTSANRVRFLAGPLPDFRLWESCRTVPLVGGFFSGDLPFPSSLHSDASPSSSSSTLKTSMLRDVQLSPLHCLKSDSWAERVGAIVDSHSGGHGFDFRSGHPVRPSGPAILISVFHGFPKSLQTSLKKRGAAVAERLAYSRIGFDPRPDRSQFSAHHVTAWRTGDLRMRRMVVRSTFSRTRQQKGVTGHQRAGTPFPNQRLVTHSPAGSPANREPSAACRSQSDAKPVPRPSHSQSENGYAHAKVTASRKEINATPQSIKQYRVSAPLGRAHSVVSNIVQSSMQVIRPSLSLPLRRSDLFREGAGTHHDPSPSGRPTRLYVARLKGESHPPPYFGEGVGRQLRAVAQTFWSTLPSAQPGAFTWRSAADGKRGSGRRRTLKRRTRGDENEAEDEVHDECSGNVYGSTRDIPEHSRQEIPGCNKPRHCRATSPWRRKQSDDEGTADGRAMPAYSSTRPPATCGWCFASRPVSLFHLGSWSQHCAPQSRAFQPGKAWLHICAVANGETTLAPTWWSVIRISPSSHVSIATAIFSDITRSDSGLKVKPIFSHDPIHPDEGSRVVCLHNASAVLLVVHSTRAIGCSLDSCYWLFTRLVRSNCFVLNRACGVDALVVVDLARESRIVIVMSATIGKQSGGKIVPHSVLREGTTLMSAEKSCKGKTRSPKDRQQISNVCTYNCRSLKGEVRLQKWKRRSIKSIGDRRRPEEECIELKSASTHSDKEVETFYEDVMKMHTKGLDCHFKIIMGDFNAIVGTEKQGILQRNDRGERLKSSRYDIRNYLPISLLTIIYKEFAKVIHNRISSTLDTAQPTEQAGFRSGFSTIDHIHVIHEVISRANEYQMLLCLAFIDFEKVFDSAHHSSVMQALLEQGVNPSHVKMLHNIYSTSTAFVNIAGATKEFYVERGVKQEDSISPKLEIVCREVGLKINLTKTKIMQNKWVAKDRVVTNDIDIETVEHYSYLDQLINMNGDSMAEIYRRIKLGWRAYGRNSIVFKSKNPEFLKKQVFNQCVLPVLTYACQTWILNCRAKQKLRTAQRGVERAMLGFTRRDRKRADYIRSVTKVRDILERVKTLKWQWAEHIARRRHDRWTTVMMDWIPRDLKRSRGRLPDRWDRDRSKSSRCGLEEHCTKSISLEGIRNNLCDAKLQACGNASCKCNERNPEFKTMSCNHKHPVKNSINMLLTALAKNDERWLPRSPCVHNKVMNRSVTELGWLVSSANLYGKFVPPGLPFSPPHGVIGTYASPLGTPCDESSATATNYIYLSPLHSPLRNSTRGSR